MSSDPKVEEIRARLANRKWVGSAHAELILTKLDEAESERDDAEVAFNASMARCIDAEERERTLTAKLAGLIDAARYMQRTERSSVTLEATLESLSRLLPSTPTEEGNSDE